MPRSDVPVEVIEDSEDEQPKSPKKKNVTDTEEKGEAVEKSASENEEEDDEEYEIEAILEAKHGAFPPGRMGYLVKWKGYGEEHNSWVVQDDAVNAQDLIDEFWKKQNKEKKSKPKTLSKSRARKSEVRDDSPKGSVPLSSSKKRKNSSENKSKASQPDGEDDNEDEDEERPKTKRTKKVSRVKETGEDKLDINGDDDPESQYRPMQKYKDRKSWESLVDHVDTIEKVEGTLKVFFTLNNGDKVVESSQECARHFPQKLIQFYESNLRWRESE